MADGKNAGQDEADDAEGVEIVKKAGRDAWEKTHGGSQGGQGK